MADLSGEQKAEVAEAARRCIEAVKGGVAEKGSYAYTDDKGNPKVEVYVYARVASPKAKKWPR